MYELKTSPYKEFISRTFNLTFNFDLLDIVARFLDRIDEWTDEGIQDTWDTMPLTNDERWTIIQHYSTPEDCCFSLCMDEFWQDLWQCATDIRQAKARGEIN